jgi:hypothetical protein
MSFSAVLNRHGGRAVLLGVERERDPLALGFVMPAGAAQATWGWPCPPGWRASLVPEVTDV